MVSEAFTHAAPESVWGEPPLLGYSQGPQCSLSLSQAAWTESSAGSWKVRQPEWPFILRQAPNCAPQGALAPIHKEKRCDAEKHYLLCTTLPCLLKNMEARQGRVKWLCRKRWKYMGGGVAVETEALRRKVKGEGTVCGWGGALPGEKWCLIGISVDCAASSAMRPSSF